jgi:hypothetical protein
MTVDIRLAKKGKKEPRDGLSQEAKAHVKLGKQHAVELAEHNWSVQDTAALEANVARLDGSMGTQTGAKTTAKSAAVSEKDAGAAAKKYIARLRRALPRALREAPDLKLTLSDFKAGEDLGESTPKISKYLSTIRDNVAKADKALAAAFTKKGALALLDEVKATLDAADSDQELARKNQPDTTQALYEVMGKVLEQIEDMNRAGQSAFEDDPTTAAKFDKQILERARKAAKKKAKAEAKPAKGEAKPAKGGAEPAKPAAPAAPAAPATPTAPEGTGASAAPADPQEPPAPKAP